MRASEQGKQSEVTIFREVFVRTCESVLTLQNEVNHILRIKVYMIIIINYSFMHVVTYIYYIDLIIMHRFSLYWNIFQYMSSLCWGSIERQFPPSQ